jgi:3-oxoacid CoA-transferase subunit B
MASLTLGGRSATRLTQSRYREKGVDAALQLSDGKLVKGMGGTMDLVAGVKRVIIVMDHTHKADESKVLPECTLPLTSTAVVNGIIPNLGVRDVVEGGLKVVETADGVTEDELRAATLAKIVN